MPRDTCRFIALVFAVAACAPAVTPGPKATPGPVVIRTQEQPDASASCAPGHIEGNLTASELWGLALIDSGGRQIEVIWPYGFAGRPSIGDAVLVKDTDLVVARTGDVLEVGGAFGADGVWQACGEIHRIGP